MPLKPWTLQPRPSSSAGSGEEGALHPSPAPCSSQREENVACQGLAGRPGGWKGASG